MQFDRASTVVIIGGGLVGLASALELARLLPDLNVTVLEKEDGVARHQSGHNSGVLHAGLYYRPGSAKARLAVSGIRRMVAYCQDRHIPFERCGKLVVATDETEIPRLRTLHERGTANGLAGLRWLTGAEAREIEPEVRSVAALHVPEEGIVDYPAVARALVGDIEALGGRVLVRTRFLGARRDGAGWVVATDRGELVSPLIVNCAGLQADRVARSLGATNVPAIVPFRGDYFKLRPGRHTLVRNLIYPVPDPAFPFLGVHFTRLIGGGVECGPNAVLALKREGYRRYDFSVHDALSALAFPGVWRFVARHSRTVAGELWRAASRRAFTVALRRLLPAIREDDLVPGGSGVRAQAMWRDGSLVEDFAFADGPGVVHVLNAPSPAATASLEIGSRVARRALTAMSRQLT